MIFNTFCLSHTQLRNQWYQSVDVICFSLSNPLESPLHPLKISTPHSYFVFNTSPIFFKEMITLNINTLRILGHSPLTPFKVFIVLMISLSIRYYENFSTVEFGSLLVNYWHMLIHLWYFHPKGPFSTFSQILRRSFSSFNFMADPLLAVAF